MISPKIAHAAMAPIITSMAETSDGSFPWSFRER